MRSFATFATIIFVTTFFLFGCAPLTKEQKEKNEFHSMILSVLERESDAGRLELHRVQAKNPTDRSGKLIALAVVEGYLSKGPVVKGYGDGRYRIKEGSVPATVTRAKIYPLFVKKVHFRITNNPVHGKIAFYESTTVEYEFEGKLNEFGKFLKKRGARLLSEGIGMCTMTKKDDGWHIGAY